MHLKGLLGPMKQCISKARGWLEARMADECISKKGLSESTLHFEEGRLRCWDGSGVGASVGMA